MTKPSNPLFSFGARGSLGRALTFRRRDQKTIAGKTPTHPDAQTPPQLGWRTMFLKCRDLWHTLSEAEQQTWESSARRQHMTGYAYYMSLCLRPNPGIYLPLAGGAMQGDIDMATNKVLNLPAPGADEEPARKVDLAGHAALTAGVHGFTPKSQMRAEPTAGQVIPTNTITVVALPNEIFDLLGEFDTATYKYTAQHADYRLIIASIRYPSIIIADKPYYTLVTRNGNPNDQVAVQGLHASNVGSLVIQCTGLTYLNAGDFIQLCSYHTAGVNITINTGNPYQTFLGVCRLP